MVPRENLNKYQRRDAPHSPDYQSLLLLGGRVRGKQTTIDVECRIITLLGGGGDGGRGGGITSPKRTSLRGVLQQGVLCFRHRVFLVTHDAVKYSNGH